ncbi:unnamed protein product [Brachionus calyciflorus]|uniref:Uncharacterized protein n=1 Tax=Brachionus calyciflorus TaxID=104777 RepID=A0A814K4D5_9BILA|nr:unnamed protein product [Brachionus calyciflorus]
MNQIIESDESSSTPIITRLVNDANDTDEDAVNIGETLPKKWRRGNLQYEQYKAYENLQECLKDIKEGLVENTT